MKWLLQRDYEQFTTYHLYEGGFRMATLKYNAAYHSIRIFVGKEKRLFFLRHGAFFSNRLALLNEYGQTIGRATFPDRQEKGQIQMETARFQYNFDETVPVVLLTGGTSNSGVKVCRLPFVRSMNVEEQVGLLLCLAWLIVEAIPNTVHLSSTALGNY